MKSNKSKRILCVEDIGGCFSTLRGQKLDENLVAWA